MNQPLRDRIMRQLESLSDERLYQVLDYVEFLESKYGIRQPPTTNVFQRFADTVEDRLRAGRVSATTIAETMALMNKAMGVLNGVAAAGKSVANDIVGAATRPGASATTSTTTTSSPTNSTSPTNSAAGAGTNAAGQGSPPASGATTPPPSAAARDGAGDTTTAPAAAPSPATPPPISGEPTS